MEVQVPQNNRNRRKIMWESIQKPIPVNSNLKTHKISARRLQPCLEQKRRYTLFFLLKHTPQIRSRYWVLIIVPSAYSDEHDGFCIHEFFPCPLSVQSRDKASSTYGSTARIRYAGKLRPHSAFKAVIKGTDTSHVPIGRLIPMKIKKIVKNEERKITFVKQENTVVR
mmetsp:Transcript_18051/g.20095  ORF Transcript_18051/g.20095 Transcript_18051/m.20095 type:complete len:168 (-) Transcript_18051:62-565(-)